MSPSTKSRGGAPSVSLLVRHNHTMTVDCADTSELLAAVERKISVPVVAFGGSYGAMLAFWLRQTYPHAIAGAIAGSAPLRVFAGWQTPDWDSKSYWATVTRGANATGGSAPRCSSNVRAAFDAMIAAGATRLGASVGVKISGCDPNASAAGGY